ncbi:MAG TPA: M20/M25/M40 family metallo-hydrolase [Gemmatimonadaceae bacterium]|nr:M20/M25/M40 family metallo-hydrolase [Gemmatimonadaceae bacterium]
MSRTRRMPAAAARARASLRPRRTLPLLALLIATTVTAQTPDWNAARDETVQHLQRMIRINTSNPPGNELPVAQYIDSVLKAAGIETHLFEPTPGRAAFVARLKGTGAKKPVILMAHMDVVGVERAHWSVDPFAGEIKDGVLYGRGAIDDKGMLAANLETMLLLKRNVLDKGGTLSRDVIFVANSDEEAGGEWGMGWLIANHPELIMEAEFALNEGGRTRIVNGKPLYVAVQNTEKVPYGVTVTAHGPGGHAAIPLAGNAIARLGRALAAIGAHQEPVVILPTTKVFFADLGAVWPDKKVGKAMVDVSSGDAKRVAAGAQVLSTIPVFNAVIRNGISPTLVSGGIRSNVIPTEATATLNIRNLPGQSIHEVVARLRQVVNDSMVEIAVVDSGVDTPASSFETPMFTAIADAVTELDPAMVTVPYLSTGATDSARLRALGMQAYGILPFPLDQNDEDRMHGNDERIPLTSLAFGTRLIYGAMLRVTR